MALVGSAGPFVQWSWVSSQQGMIISLLWQHVQLTAIAVGLGHRDLAAAGHPRLEGGRRSALPC